MHPNTSRSHIHRVLRLAEEALELPAAERRAFVEARCPDDPELAEEALVLARDDPAHGFMETLPVPPTPARRGAGRGVTSRPPVDAASRPVLRLPVAVTAISGLLLAVTAAFASTRVCLENERALRRAADVEEQRAERAAAFLLGMFDRIDPDRDGPDVTVATLVERSVDGLEAHFDDDPELAASVLGRLGDAMRKLARFDEANDAFREQARLLRERMGPDALPVARVEAELAQGLLRTGRTDESRALARHALATAEAGDASDPERLLVRASAHSALSIASREDGRLERAVEMQREAVELAMRANGAGSREALTARTALATTLASAGRLDEAVDLGRDVAAGWRSLDGPDSLRALAALDAVASALLRLGRTDDALAIRFENLAARRRLHGSRHPRTLRAESELANELVDAGRGDEADAILAGLVHVIGELDEVTPEMTAPFLERGWLLLEQERSDEAEAAFRGFLDVAVRAWPDGDWRIADGRRGLGSALWAQGDAEGAARELRASHSILEETFGPEAPPTQRVVGLLVQLYERTGDEARRRDWSERLGGEE